MTSEFTYFDAVRFLHDVTFAAAQIDLAAGIGRRSGLLDRRGGHFQCVKVQAVLEFQFAGIWLQLRMRWIRFRRPEQLENNCKVQAASCRIFCGWSTRSLKYLRCFLRGQRISLTDHVTDVGSVGPAPAARNSAAAESSSGRHTKKWENCCSSRCTLLV